MEGAGAAARDAAGTEVLEGPPPPLARDDEAALSVEAREGASLVVDMAWRCDGRRPRS